MSEPLANSVGHPILGNALAPRSPAPPGIPTEPLVDPHAEFAAEGDYESRRAAFLDFGVLRLMLQCGEDPRLPPALVARARASILGFCFHPSERRPGARDALCTWTENHQIPSGSRTSTTTRTCSRC